MEWNREMDMMKRTGEEEHFFVLSDETIEMAKSEEETREMRTR